MAKLEPHAAFIALSKSIQNEWLYVQRVVADSEYAFIPLQQIIKNLFFPNLSGLEFDNKETDLLCRPTHHLGLGIHDPVKTASNQFTVSKIATSFLTQTIITGTPLDISLHEASLRNGANEKQILEKQLQTDTLALIESFDDSRKRSLVKKLNQKCSAWLSVIPSKSNHFDLSPDEFRDAIALRYGRTPSNLLRLCDADSEEFDVNHTLNCSKGGLVCGRINDCGNLNDKPCLMFV